MNSAYSVCFSSSENSQHLRREKKLSCSWRVEEYLSFQKLLFLLSRHSKLSKERQPWCKCALHLKRESFLRFKKPHLIVGQDCLVSECWWIWHFESEKWIFPGYRRGWGAWCGSIMPSPTLERPFSCNGNFFTQNEVNPMRNITVPRKPQKEDPWRKSDTLRLLIWQFTTAPELEYRIFSHFLRVSKKKRKFNAEANPTCNVPNAQFSRAFFFAFDHFCKWFLHRLQTPAKRAVSVQFARSSISTYTDTWTDEMLVCFNMSPALQPRAVCKKCPQPRSPEGHASQRRYLLDMDEWEQWFVVTGDKPNIRLSQEPSDHRRTLFAWSGPLHLASAFEKKVRLHGHLSLALVHEFRPVKDRKWCVADSDVCEILHGRTCMLAAAEQLRQHNYSYRSTLDTTTKTIHRAKKNHTGNLSHDIGGFSVARLNMESSLVLRGVGAKPPTQASVCLNICRARATWSALSHWFCRRNGGFFSAKCWGSTPNLKCITLANLQMIKRYITPQRAHNTRWTFVQKRTCPTNGKQDANNRGNFE